MPASAATPAAPAAAAAGRDFAAASPPGLVQQLLGLPFPPFAPLIGSEAGSFAQDTITTRLPAIMDTVLADLQAEGAAAGSGPNVAQLQQQLEAAAAGVKAMQQEMPADGPLLLLQVPATLPAGHPLQEIIPVTNAAVAAWQQHTARQQQQPPPEGATAAAAPATWLQLPWLLVECYLYVRLAMIIAEQPLLVASGYDPFFRQKAAALAKSLTAAADIAAAAAALLQQQQAAVAVAGCGRRQQLAALTSEDSRSRLCQILQYSLWGNKTDLSMLVDVAHLDPSATADAASSAANIIADDSDRLWQHLTSAAASRAAQLESSPSSAAGSPEGLAAALPRIDVILDNAGLELVSDLWLADFLVSGGWAEQVVLHGKALPWFVSDTLARDLTHLLESCAAVGSGSAEVAAAAARWTGHLQAGRWRWAADPFWTTPFPFAWMEQLAPELHADLARSSLLVFKGDLNYRKLAHDCRWPPTTPFKTALQGFGPTALLSLRTLKADVIAGLVEGEAAALDRLDARWQVNGKFGVVQFDA